MSFRNPLSCSLLVKACLLLLYPFLLCGGELHAQTFNIQSAGDFGGAHRSFPASNAIDGNTAFSSRWAANYRNGGGDVNLFVDLGSVQRVDDIGIAWGAGDQFSYNFEVRARRGTSGRWTVIRSRGNSSGNTSGIELYRVEDFDARQVRIKVFSTEGNLAWANVTEFEVYGTSGPSGSNGGGGGGGGGSAGELVPTNITGTSSGSNGPFNVIDGNLGTRFSSNGIGRYLQLDLGRTQRVSSVDLAWFRGNSRSMAFEVLVGTTTRNLTRVFTGTSSGSTNSLRNYNFSDRDGRYVRIVGLGNTSNNWLSITEARVFAPGASTARADSSGPSAPAPAPTPTPAPTGGSGTADNIIGSGWKLNGFSGTLRVGNNDNGLDYADDASKRESHFFFERNGYAAFRCYPGSPTSGGSSNPRSELREVIRGGDGFWNGDTSTERSMKWKVRIEDLPPSGKLCFGQIHERDDRFDDIIRVQVEGSEGQNSGSVDIRILGYVTEELEGSGRTVGTMNMDQEYNFELTMSRGVVRLYMLNSSGSRTRTLYTSGDVGNADENYFKAGCYLQSTRSSHADSNVYGQVLIKDVILSIDD